jgi:hypothetical protein
MTRLPAGRFSGVVEGPVECPRFRLDFWVHGLGYPGRLVCADGRHPVYLFVVNGRPQIGGGRRTNDVLIGRHEGGTHAEPPVSR